jgi:hypothetical protein
MKTARTLITITMLLVAASTLFAQIESRPLMKVNVPFSFSVDTQSLPAGEYFVISITPERSIRLSSTDGKHTLTVNDLPNYASSPSPNSRLVFHKYGNEYFLEQVWTRGESVARNPYVSKRAMELAQSGSHPDTEIVLASLGR